MPKYRVLTPKGASFTVAGGGYDLEREALDAIGAEIIEAPANEAEFIAAAKTADAIYAKGMPISKAVIDQSKCIQCGRCHIACEDTSHQAITASRDGKRYYAVKDDECVGCNLCVTVCPVDECITLRTLVPGEIDSRTGQRVAAVAADWTTHPNNPMRRPEVPA